jgi:hypothetical protein
MPCSTTSQAWFIGSKTVKMQSYLRLVPMTPIASCSDLSASFSNSSDATPLTTVDDAVNADGTGLAAADGCVGRPERRPAWS